MRSVYISFIEIMRLFLSLTIKLRESWLDLTCEQVEPQKKSQNNQISFNHGQVSGLNYSFTN